MIKAGPEDTIAAISTPLGVGGIGIVRMSGPGAQRIAHQVFRPKRGEGPLLSHRLYLGDVIHPEDGRVLDEAFLVAMQKPKTYTREDVVEIQCHSGALVLQAVLAAVLRCGARLAEPGEFTKRAFLNGRIDLTQAEAVMDLIQSKTQKSLELANSQRSGRLAAAIRRLREETLNLLAHLEASIDFPDEEIPEFSSRELGEEIERLREELDRLVKTYEEGKIYREGLATAIVGKPNVGKSSLLNALLQEERAIVTPIPGTTRDVLEGGIAIKGIPLRLLDTAGLRRAQDVIEEEGVRRTQTCLANADLAIWVVDGSQPLDVEDLDILPLVRSRKAVLAVNKRDLPLRMALDELREKIPEAPVVWISALIGTGIDELKEAIWTAVLGGRRNPSGEIILANLRHKQGLESAREALSEALRSQEGGLSAEFIVFDIRQALEALGDVLGESASEEVLERIFNQFCIGK
jgi:tRNA modification GTPase